MGEHEGAGGWGFIKGGMGAITQAIAQSGARFGLEVGTDCPIAKVLVTTAAPRGVVTEAGEEYRAPLVISNLNAKTLMLGMVEPPQLPEDYLRDLRGFRTFSTAFKINVACHRPPQYTAFDAGHGGLRLSDLRPHRAGHRVSRARLRRRQVRLVVQAARSSRRWCRRSATTPSPRPASTWSTCSAATRPTSSRVRSGTQANRQKLVDAVLDAIETFAPGWRNDIIAMQVLLAPDLERIVGLPQGHIFHGELAPDQVFFTRPAAHYADYRTPDPRPLYLRRLDAPGRRRQRHPGLQRRP